jgi:regulatory protein
LKNVFSACEPSSLSILSTIKITGNFATYYYTGLFKRDASFSQLLRQFAKIELPDLPNKEEKMAIITKVSAQKRQGRYNIFLDQEYAFSVSEKTLAEFVLLKGQELSPQKVNEILDYEASAKASDLAARYLSYQPRTVKEVTDYLSQHEISRSAAKRAVNELTQLGYLDDAAYARLFIKNNLQVGKNGPGAVRRDLKKKGVDEDLIEAALADVTDEEWAEVGKRLVKSLLGQQGKIAKREVDRKMQTKLLSHGFSGSLAQAVTQELVPEADEDQEREALAKQGLKAYKRFKRYEPGVREQKMRQYLYSHGFSGDEISAFLAGEIIPLEELEEY